jgi:hypothetical protein
VEPSTTLAEKMQPDIPAPSPSFRTVEVRPPSARDEESAVFLSAVFIVLCVIYIVAFEVYDGAAKQRDRGLLPYQVLFTDLPPEEQRIFRQMREGFDEALVEHGQSGEWPDVARLAADGVPPFAGDSLDRSRLRWTVRSDGLATSYVGIPGDGGAFPAYLVRIQAPDPQAIERLSQPNAALDEEHRALPDGTLLHVTYWRRERAPVDDAVGADPARDGWSQIRLKSLFELSQEQKTPP